MNRTDGFASIIIVNYNTGDILEECVESVYRHEDTDKFEIIIVDNHSPDNSPEVIEKLSSRHSNIKYLLNESKLSFSQSNNEGFALATGEYVIIMNPDIIFTSPVISRLKQRISSEGLSACSPLLTGSDGKFQRNYYQRFPSIRQFIYFYSFLSKIFGGSARLTNKFLHNCDIDPDTDKLWITEQLPCAFYFTTSDLYERAGMMDPGYKLFFEDVDLSYRMRNFGKLGVDSSAAVTHLGGSSFKREDDFWLYGRFICGMLTFFGKHYSSRRYSMLKFISRLNSCIILSGQKVLSPAGRKDGYRVRKHEYFLEQLKELD